MLRKVLGFVAGVALAAAVGVGPGYAGTIALEGSDATSLHGDATYTFQLISFLKSDSTFPALPVLVWDPAGSASSILGLSPAGTVEANGALPALLGSFSGVYIQSPGSCCDQALPFLDAGEKATIAAFVAAGGSLSIQDYQGGDWSPILSFVPPAGAVGGFGGTAGGPGCWDTQIFLPAALAKGFTQPPVLGCWTHQAYDNTFFGPLGFTSLVDSGPEFDRIGSGDWSSFLALGGVLGSTSTTITTTTGTPGVPLPASVVLLGAGLTALAAWTRGRRS